MQNKFKIIYDFLCSGNWLEPYRYLDQKYLELQSENNFGKSIVLSHKWPKPRVDSISDFPNREYTSMMSIHTNTLRCFYHDLTDITDIFNYNFIYYELSKWLNIFACRDKILELSSIEFTKADWRPNLIVNLLFNNIESISILFHKYNQIEIVIENISLYPNKILYDATKKQITFCWNIAPEASRKTKAFNNQQFNTDIAQFLKMNKINLVNAPSGELALFKLWLDQERERINLAYPS